MGCVSHFDPVGELPRKAERSDDQCVGARIFAWSQTTQLYAKIVKPSGEAMRSLAEQIVAKGVPRRTIGPLKLDADAWYKDPTHNFDRLFREWRGRI